MAPSEIPLEHTLVHEDAPEPIFAPHAPTASAGHDAQPPPLLAPGDISPAVLDRFARMEVDFATAIRTAIAALEEKSLTRSEVPLSLCGPRSPRGPCAPLGGALTLTLAAAPRPGLGARGFLCNMRTKGFYGLRGEVVSVESQRAGVIINETGKLVFVLLTNLVFGHGFPEPLLLPAACSPHGPPGLLQDLTFFAFHPAGTAAAASGGLADHSAPRRDDS